MLSIFHRDITRPKRLRLHLQLISDFRQPCIHHHHIICDPLQPKDSVPYDIQLLIQFTAKHSFRIECLFFPFCCSAFPPLSGINHPTPLQAHQRFLFCSTS
ncbi:hypothetical protein TRVL_09305 [Trypanosoma vivax]|nr:hypothetical protein TRVL_09305 [Trypanosoma vivax]